MNQILNTLKDIRAEHCITIIMNTHRTKPDYLKDELALKNHIKEVESRLMADMTKGDAAEIIGKLSALAKQIDHSRNLDSLLIFVNHDVAEYSRLPIKVVDRVIIDDTFATRDLVRSIHDQSHYYILVLSQEKGRLIEALNDQVIKEFGAPFPMENTQFLTRDKAEYAVDAKHTNLIAEFFNRVDKEVNAVRNKNPLPVLLCTVEENYGQYLKVADHKERFYKTVLNKNKISEKAQDIVMEASKMIEDYNDKMNNERKSELMTAVSENKFLSDTNEIWKAISEGKIQTLFIEEGLFQSAILKDGEIEYISENHRTDANVIDDIYDEMIELNMKFGGDVVFLPKGELEKFNGFGAVTRY